MSIISRGFSGRRSPADAKLPPGQYLTPDFPVLSAGPTPHIPLDKWDFSIVGKVAEPKRWSWAEFRALPSQTTTTDIHCVTRWSKFDTVWEGVSLDTLLDQVQLDGGDILAFSDRGHTTNLPLADVTGGKGGIAPTYNGQPLAPEHGGPARLL